MFVFFLAFLAYVACFIWIAVYPEAWWAGLGVGVFVSLAHMRWYLPRKLQAWLSYGAPTLLFFCGATSFLLLVDQQLIWLFVCGGAVGLSFWWRTIYVYFNQKEEYRVLMIPQTAQWFLPIGFFLVMSGLWGVSVFFGTALGELFVFALVAWIVSLACHVWFHRLDWKPARIMFLVLTVGFIEMTYVLYLLPNTFFLKATLHTLFFIASGFMVRLNFSQHKAVQLVTRLGVVLVVLLVSILVTARWK